MILKNVSQDTLIFNDIKIAHSFIDQLFGLLQQSNQAMLFYTRFGIHTFLMRTNIDVMVLDNEWKVVKLKENLSTNKLFFWNPKFNIVIELPSRTIKKSKTKLGDNLKMTKK